MSSNQLKNDDYKRTIFVRLLYNHNQTIACDFCRITNFELFNFISKRKYYQATSYSYI